MRHLRLPFALALSAAMAVPVQAADAPLQLAGTKWRITTIDGQPALYSGAEIEFLANRLSATVGCNNLSGDWQLHGTHLMTGPVIGTRMACANLMEQENAVAAALGASPTVSRDGADLVLTGGGHRLTLSRRN